MGATRPGDLYGRGSDPAGTTVYQYLLSWLHIPDCHDRTPGGVCDDPHAGSLRERHVGRLEGDRRNRGDGIFRIGTRSRDTGNGITDFPAGRCRTHCIDATREVTTRNTIFTAAVHGRELPVNGIHGNGEYFDPHLAG